MGLLGWAGYASMIYIGSTEVPANTPGAFVAALVSTLLIRRTTIPAFGQVSAALLPLIPGPLPLQRPLAGGRNLPGDSQSK